MPCLRPPAVTQHSRSPLFLHLYLKTLRFFRTAVAQHDAEFYFKVDDDMHVVTHRWPAAVQQWRAESAGYIGCAGGEGFVVRGLCGW